MRRIFFTLFVTLSFLCCGGASLSAAQESSRGAKRNSVTRESDVKGIEIDVSDGNIWIASPEPATVKVYSILGDLVLSIKVEQGLTSIPINKKGIYLVNANSVIKRVVL